MSSHSATVVELVARWITDHYHPCSNLSVGISEGCFVFNFALLPLEVARPILPTMRTKVDVIHPPSSSPNNIEPVCGTNYINTMSMSAGCFVSALLAKKSNMNYRIRLKIHYCQINN